MGKEGNEDQREIRGVVSRTRMHHVHVCNCKIANNNIFRIKENMQQIKKADCRNQQVLSTTKSANI